MGASASLSPARRLVESLPAAHQAVRRGLATGCFGHQVTCGQETGKAGPRHVSNQDEWGL